MTDLRGPRQWVRPGLPGLPAAMEAREDVGDIFFTMKSLILAQDER